MPLKMRRTSLGIENKRGNVPVTVFEDTRLELVEGRPTLTGPAPGSWQLEQVDPRDPRWSVGTANLKGGRPLRGQYAAQISRALLKIGFEAAWPQLGVRRQPGYIFVVNHLDDKDGGHNIHFTAVANPENGRADLYVATKMLGVYMATDSFRVAPPPSLTPELGYTASF
jgi:hypothetical protein